MLRSFFNEMVIPELINNLSAEHILNFTGTVDDLNKLDKIIIKQAVRAEIIKRLLSGKTVTQEDAKALENRFNSDLKGRGGKRFLNIKKDFYRDVEFEFDIMVNNEQEDVAVLANNYFTALDALAKNPEMLKNPLTRAVFNQWAQRIGISPAKLELIEQQEAENAPQPMQMPSMPQLPQGQPNPAQMANLPA